VTASGDDSVERLQAILDERYPGSSRLLALGHNGGFASGNNAAVRDALSWPEPRAYFLLLNPETVPHARRAGGRGAAGPLSRLLG